MGGAILPNVDMLDVTVIYPNGLKQTGSIRTVGVKVMDIGGAIPVGTMFEVSDGNKTKTFTVDFSRRNYVVTFGTWGITFNVPNIVARDGQRPQKSQKQILVDPNTGAKYRIVGGKPQLVEGSEPKQVQQAQRKIGKSGNCAGGMCFMCKLDKEDCSCTCHSQVIPQFK